MIHNYDDYADHYNNYVNEELNAMPSDDELDDDFVRELDQIRYGDSPFEHDCESTLTADGYGAYCPICGESVE